MTHQKQIILICNCGRKNIFEQIKEIGTEKRD